MELTIFPDEGRDLPALLEHLYDRSAQERMELASVFAYGQRLPKGDLEDIRELVRGLGPSPDQDEPGWVERIQENWKGSLATKRLKSPATWAQTEARI